MSAGAITIETSTSQSMTRDVYREMPPAVEVEDTSFQFDSMENALAAFANGEFLVVMDDEGRENEGDLIIAASLCTTEKMAFMIKHTSLVQLRLLTSLLNIS